MNSIQERVAGCLADKLAKDLQQTLLNCLFIHDKHIQARLRIDFLAQCESIVSHHLTTSFPSG